MGLSPIEWNKFGSLQTFDRMNTYFINREYEHGHYFHGRCADKTSAE
ncbi:MAG: hypothetical protein NC078_04390 [Ruminococcus sp.]|nr:hypothetical protein [Ruminococcus sp.]